MKLDNLLIFKSIYIYIQKPFAACVCLEVFFLQNFFKKTNNENTFFSSCENRKIHKNYNRDNYKMKSLPSLFVF